MYNYNIHYTITIYIFFFDINDLSFFHKIVYGNVSILLPEYIEPYRGQDRLRQANLRYVCTFTSSSYPSIISPFYKSFFYRVVHTWNSLPHNLRNIANIHSFKQQAICHYLNAHSMT